MSYRSPYFVLYTNNTSTYTVTLTQGHNLKKMRDTEQIWGWVAFAAFNIIYASSLQFIRRRFYEAFYMTHVVMFVLSVIGLGLHKPKKFAFSVVAIGAIWCVDRIIRTCRLIYYSFNNTATLIPLPGLATKVVFKKPINCQPGSHAFINIPAIRRFQSHPFTISSADNIEFVIRAQKGFTLDLHKYALKNSGKQLKAFIDGPYGAVPDFRRMNKVVLFAGGTGGAFSFPIAIDIVRNAGRIETTHLEFVWVIRDERSYSFSHCLVGNIIDANKHRNPCLVRIRNCRTQQVSHSERLYLCDLKNGHYCD
jgi:predicted ferric reductase